MPDVTNDVLSPIPINRIKTQRKAHKAMTKEQLHSLKSFINFLQIFLVDTNRPLLKAGSFKATEPVRADYLGEHIIRVELVHDGTDIRNELALFRAWQNVTYYAISFTSESRLNNDESTRILFPSYFETQTKKMKGFTSSEHTLLVTNDVLCFNMGKAVARAPEEPIDRSSDVAEINIMMRKWLPELIRFVEEHVVAPYQHIYNTCP